VTPPRWLAGANPRRTAVRAGLLVVAAYVTFTYVLLPVRGVGISMQPTIDEGDLIFVNMLAYRFREPRRGDIVAVRIAGRSIVYVKRIVALPGDEFAFVDGLLHVNDVAVDEPYVVNRSPWNLGPVTLETDQYFVVGDNRGMRIDQHDMGTVGRDRLIGAKLSMELR
jgi:signal peptidase I